MKRDEFLRAVWRDVINTPQSEVWIDNIIALSRRDPQAPFADLGGVLEGLLAKGATRQELSALRRCAAYEAAFQLLYMLVGSRSGRHDHVARVLSGSRSVRERRARSGAVAGR